MSKKKGQVNTALIIAAISAGGSFAAALIFKLPAWVPIAGVSIALLIVIGIVSGVAKRIFGKILRNEK